MDRLAVTVLGTTRACVGALSLLAPATAATVFGLDKGTTPFATRLFASRELALALALLAAQGADLRKVAQVGAAVDAVDVLSAAVEKSRGTLSTFGAVFGGVGAAGFVALGLLIARGAGARD